MPDAGSLAEDLELFLRSVHAVLADPRLLRLFHALSVATASDDEELHETVRAFWERRFGQAAPMIEPAARREPHPKLGGDGACSARAVSATTRTARTARACA